MFEGILPTIRSPASSITRHKNSVARTAAKGRRKPLPEAVPGAASGPPGELKVDIDELGDADMVGPDDPVQQENNDPEYLEGQNDELMVSDEKVPEFHSHDAARMLLIGILCLDNYIGGRGRKSISIFSRPVRERMSGLSGIGVRPPAGSGPLSSGLRDLTYDIVKRDRSGRTATWSETPRHDGSQRG
jgi:hypothetical protein